MLTAEIKMSLQLPFAFADAGQMPHKFTLTNDDSSYSKTLSLASDAQAGSIDGTSVILFTEMTEEHTYTLTCDDGTGTPIVVFEGIDYDKLVDTFAASANAAPTADPTSRT